MSLLYLDSSALVKLVAREPETPALLSLLEPRPEVVSRRFACIWRTRPIRSRRFRFAFSTYVPDRRVPE